MLLYEYKSVPLPPKSLNYYLFYMKHYLLCAVALMSNYAMAQKVDYSVVYVPQESGIQFTRMTSDNDMVCMPIVKRTRQGVGWLSNRILDISLDNTQLAYLSARNGMTNIFIKNIQQQGSSRQRTNRQSVLDFSYSPDGQKIVFSEQSGKQNQIFQTDAENGYICRQITSGNQDYSPVYSVDKKQIFFTRQENNGSNIWSYSVENNFLSNYTRGMNPCPLSDGKSVLCARMNAEGRSEIWRIDYTTSVEECIVSDPHKSFTTPSISPDGKWILMVGSSEIATEAFSYWNTDIYVCRIDGSQLSQLTYHAADDLSPAWSRDGGYIFFISQRGSATATANVWMMNFAVE